MSGSSQPPSLEQWGPRPFAFYPAIINFEHNEWIYQRSTWSEVLVKNAKDGTEIWVARHLIGEVSRVDHPMMIVGLRKELEYRAGALWPYHRRVIEMPRAVNDLPRGYQPPAVPEGPAPVIGIKLEPGPESRIGRLIGAVLILGVILCVLAVGVYRGVLTGRAVTYKPVLQSDLGLSGRDDYYAVVRMLGLPSADHWKAGEGVMQYRILSYPSRGMSVILMGVDRDKALYVGTIDDAGRPLHAVPMGPGRDSRAILRGLGKF